MPPEASASILLVDDDPATIRLMGRALAGMGELRFATSGASALQAARVQPPDLILLDAEMPGMSGFQVCETLKADALLAGIPVIFVTSHRGQDFELKGLEIGAADFVAKPINEPLLRARVRTQLRVKHLTDQLRQQGTVDVLTGTFNRRSFDQLLTREWCRAMRLGEPMSLLMVDVDHFKRFNAHHGHLQGDNCLRAIARALRAATSRPADVVARHDGATFALLLPQTPCSGAARMARRMLDAVEQLAIRHEASPMASHVTVSVGVSTHDRHGAGRGGCGSDAFGTPAPWTASDLVKAADHALCAAKAHGRAQAWQLEVGQAGDRAHAREVAYGPLAGRHRPAA